MAPHVEAQRLPLDGFVVGITADRRATEQAEMFRRRGARVLVAPTVQTVPLAADAGIRAVTEAIVADPPAVLIANTGIGIRSWFAAAESWGRGEALLDALRAARVLARGPKGAGAVLTAGLAVDWRAPSETLAEVVSHLLTEPVDGMRIVLQLDGDAHQYESQRLRDAGADVLEVRVYEWTLPQDPEPALRLVEAVCAGRVDAVTFTSAAAVANLVALADGRGLADDLRAALNDRVLAMCVGPVCASAATARGIRALQPERARLGAMVHALTDELSSRRQELRLDGHDVVIQGEAVAIDGERAVLSDRERAVLDLLLERGGAVVSRTELLRSVWGGDADAHALEVTITRLRQRLGQAGRAVKTVVRRGYRLELG